MISGARVDDLFTAIFRANGRLIEGGNQLVSGLGLTSAWWQVLGAVALSGEPLTVPQIAREMGLARQSVQRTVDLLVEDGLAEQRANPNHRRAMLVALTAAGDAAYREAIARQRPWAGRMLDGLSDKEISIAIAVLRQIGERASEALEKETAYDTLP